jgi:hypothetical protein
MSKLPYIVLTLSIVVFFGAGTASAQWNDDPFPERDPQRREEAKRIKDMLAKQQAIADKKDHEELLKRADEALKLSNDLEQSFETNSTLTLDDKKKLESLEKIALKIRNELGGDDDEASEKELTEKASSLGDTFRYLQSTTVQLVDELKKTTRFSISAVAIQTSNTLIRLTRFLRLRR